MIVTESRRRWGRARELALPRAAQGAVTSLDCTGSGSCVAVGHYTVSATNSAGFVVTESKGRWGRVRRLSLPPNATAGMASSAGAVACPQPGSCVVLGSYNDLHGIETWAATESHGRWQAAREIRPPSGSPASNRDAEPSSVACPRAGACVAVGTYQGARGGSRAFAVSQAGGRWRPAVQVQAPSNASTPPNAGLGSVSCPGIGTCVSAGWYTTTSGRQQEMIATDSRGRWQQAQVLSMLPPNASVTAESSLNTIACPTLRSCVAAGIYQDSAGGGPAMYLPESGGTGPGLMITSATATVRSPSLISTC